MLFVLTGNVQTGKSRWLERLVSDLGQHGVPSYGVLSPGTWAESAGARADANGYEKLGIQSVLLPDGARFCFGVRRDLAQGAETAQQESESDRACLGWQISEVALARVNGHFRSLDLDVPMDGLPGLLVVDELGKLEFQCGGGLTEALRLVDAGPRPTWPHALVVVRRSLVEQAVQRFQSTWGAVETIAPCSSGREAVLGELGVVG